MLYKYGEKTQPCRTPFVTLNHSDSVPATLTSASCFLYSLASRTVSVGFLFVFHSNHCCKMRGFELGAWHRDNARNNATCTEARKATHGLDGQHQDVDRTLRGRVSQNDTEDRDKWRKCVRGPTLGSRTAKELNRTAWDRRTDIGSLLNAPLSAGRIKGPPETRRMLY